MFPESEGSPGGLQLERGAYDQRRMDSEEWLVLIAMQLDFQACRKVVGPWNDEPWQAFMPDSLKAIWELLDYSERLAVFVVAQNMAMRFRAAPPPPAVASELLG